MQSEWGQDEVTEAVKFCVAERQAPSLLSRLATTRPQNATMKRQILQRLRKKAAMQMDLWFTKSVHQCEVKGLDPNCRIEAIESLPYDTETKASLRNT